MKIVIAYLSFFSHPLKMVIVLSSSGIVYFVEKYFFSDWEFLVFLLIMMSVDTVMGVIKAWKAGTISSSGFGRFFVKILIYFSVLIVTHILTNFAISGEKNMIFLWIDDLFYSAMLVREAISILENAASINNTILPPWILKRLKSFDKTGKINNTILPPWILKRLKSFDKTGKINKLKNGDN